MSNRVLEVNVNEVARLTQSEDCILLDVRETWEIKLAAITDAVCIPMHQVPEQLEQLNKDLAIYVLCHHGGRSLQVAQYLVRHGYEQVFNVSGGIHAWSCEVDKDLATY